MAKKLKVNSDVCVGCGLCVGTYPETFEFDDEGKAKVVAQCDDASAEEAISACPAGAIEEDK